MKKYNVEFLGNAHKGSSCHKEKNLSSKLCGCFYCKKSFKKEAIVEWIDEDNSGKEKTAICPICGIDSVLGDEFPVSDKEFLKAMNKLWF